MEELIIEPEHKGLAVGSEQQEKVASRRLKPRVVSTSKLTAMKHLVVKNLMWSLYRGCALS